MQTEKFEDFNIASLHTFESTPEDNTFFSTFEKGIPVLITTNKNYISVLINGRIVCVRGEHTLSHNQRIFLDLFSKGLYYGKLSTYKNLDLYKTMDCVRKDNKAQKKERFNHFACTLRDLIDGKINNVEIAINGDITTSFIPTTPEQE